MLITDATNLPRLMNCNGSRIMAAVLPPDSDPTARDEGNAAHWLAQQWFKGVPIDSLVDTKAFNGFVISGEMVDHVGEYIASLNCGEMEIDTSFAGANWQVNARADHIVFDFNHPDEQTQLTVDDFKYGWRIVEPEMNWTLIAHAIGWCIRYNTQPTEIVLRIHQPRPYHPAGKLREWRIDYATLMTLYAQINETLSNPSEQLQTGPWCAKCYALPTCPAARLAGYNAIDATALAFNDMMPDDVLSYELDVLRTAQATLKTRLDALQELTIHRIKNGGVVPNYGLEPQYANTRFKPGISPAMLTLASGIDCNKPGTITPAEFKRRGGSDAALKTLTERPMTGTKLIRSDVNVRAQRLLGKPQD